MENLVLSNFEIMKSSPAVSLYSFAVISSRRDHVLEMRATRRKITR
jgi:hypothetical protein